MSDPVSDGPVWLGFDLGTQSVRALLADTTGQVLATATRPLTSHRSGRKHTQEPEQWWQAVCACCREVTATIAPERIAALAVDATSGTILLTDQQLQPASEALMYDDTRAQAEAAEVQQHGQALWADLGYAMQPSSALPKLLWLARRQPSGPKGLHLTHQNDFIHGRLAGRRLPTDTSHALKSGYDLDRNCWPLDLLAGLGLPVSLFPEAVPPGSLIGEVSPAAAAQTGLRPGTPIISGMTDGCAAQLSSGAVTEGSWNSVLGTTLVLKGVTAQRLHDPLNVIYSHRSADGKWLPGGASSTGAGLISTLFPPGDLDTLAATASQRPPTSLLVYPLAATGERFPFFAPEATGFQSRSPADPAEHYRAILQGVAFLERLAFDYLALLGADTSGSLSISGGATRSPLWNQIRADVLGRTLSVPAVTEPAFGMSLLAAASCSSLAEAARQMIRTGSEVQPSPAATAACSPLYHCFVEALVDRRWLPETLAAFSLRRWPTA